MIAVIFEVVPSAAGRQPYLDTAASLRCELERMDGFVSIERFESLSQPGKLLSLSFWRDEAAVAQWRSGASARAIARRRPPAARACSPTIACAWRPCCATTG
ncbi:hypothetical protein AVME950_22365 [Acidovorax sp. SUPP950]|nr:hypothetical protein AVME950_22365 [Acidovorax sp. SUPP950]